MMNRLLTLLFVSVLGICRVFAQQTPLYSQYYLNPFLYNPATAGIGGYGEAFFLYRKEMTGVEGSPETEAFTVSGQLNNRKWGLGLSFVNDVTNVIGRINVGMTGAYTVSLAENQKLSFGMTGMLIQNRIYFDRIQGADVSDPALLTSVNNQTTFDMNAGLNYRWKRLNLGGAVNQMLQRTFTYENASQFESLDYQLVRHYVATLSYDFALGEQFTLKPLVMTRVIEGLSPQWDANLILNYQQWVWAGVSYRHQIGVGGSLGFLIEDQITVGYSYEYPTTDLARIGAGSHEFTLGIRFGGGRDRLFASSSGDQKGPSRRNAMSDADAAQYEKIDQLEARNEKNEARLRSYETLIDRQQQEIDALKARYEAFEAEVEELKTESAYQEGDTTETGDRFFLIVGAFRTFDHAKQFQRIMQREGNLATRVVQNDRKTWYLIYSEELSDLKEIQSKIRSLQNSDAASYIVGNPWVFVQKSNDR